MKRTIKEVYDLIKEKRDNAEKCCDNTSYSTVPNLHYVSRVEANAYTDVLSLIESSHLLEEDKSKKALEIIKRNKSNYTLDFIKTTKNYNNYICLMANCDMDSEYTQEEYDLLKEVLV